MRDEDIIKVKQAGFRVIRPEQTLLCIREHLEDGWRVVKRFKKASTMRDSVRRMLNKPHFIHG